MQQMMQLDLGSYIMSGIKSRKVTQDFPRSSFNPDKLQKFRKVLFTTDNFVGHVFLILMNEM